MLHSKEEVKLQVEWRFLVADLEIGRLTWMDRVDLMNPKDPYRGVRGQNTVGS